MANAKVEVAVQIAQRWILARLRNHRFFSLAELNVAIRRLLDALNMRVMRGDGASRADLFATLDRSPKTWPRPRHSGRLRRSLPLQHANIRGGGYYHFEWTKMLTHPTHDRLLALGLTGIASALEEQRRSTAFDDLFFEERPGLLVDCAAAERDGDRKSTRLNSSHQ